MPTKAMNEWVARVLGISDGSAANATDGRPAGGGALAGWTAARATALASLKSLENAIRTFEDEDVDEALILLRSVQANLTAEPATEAQVAELERYLQTDDVISDAETPNGFDITIELRTPLLTALAAFGAEQSRGRAP